MHKIDGRKISKFNKGAPRQNERAVALGAIYKKRLPCVKGADAEGG
jgi:hypothetical protein